MRRIISAIAAMLLINSVVAPAEAVVVTKSTKVAVPAAPSIYFAGSPGGDGFNAVATNGHVYSIFHHQDRVTVACLDQVSAQPCTYGGNSFPVTYYSAAGVNYSLYSPMTSYGFLSTDEKKLYVYAVDWMYSAGVLCINLSNMVECGYTALDVYQGDSMLPQDGWTESATVDWGSPARIGNKIYQSIGNGFDAYLSCFDLSKGSQCADAPYYQFSRAAAPYNGVLNQSTYLQGPKTVAYGTKVFTAFDQEEGALLNCFDTLTLAACGSSSNWPVAIEHVWGLLPVLDDQGQIDDICLAFNVDSQCFDASSGVSVSVPSWVKQHTPYEYTEAGAFFGQAIVVGTRIVFNSSVNWVSTQITCIEFQSGVGVSCGTYYPQNAVLLYSLTEDTQRSGCIWLDSDTGSGQIQNFDALTMEAGCAGVTRISRTQVTPDNQICEIANWHSLTINNLPSGAEGFISITDQLHRSLAGADHLLWDAQGHLDLSSIDFGDVTNPWFEFHFTSGNVTRGLLVDFSYDQEDAAQCTLPKKTIYAEPDDQIIRFGDSVQQYAMRYYLDSSHLLEVPELQLFNNITCTVNGDESTWDVGTYENVVNCGQPTIPGYRVRASGAGDLTIYPRNPNIHYTGTSGTAPRGASIEITAELSPSICTGDLRYFVNPNPIDGSGNELEVPGGDTDTSSWRFGSYQIRVLYEGNQNCTSANAFANYFIFISPSRLNLSTRGNGTMNTEYGIMKAAWNIRSKNVGGITGVTTTTGTFRAEVAHQWRLTAKLNDVFDPSNKSNPGHQPLIEYPCETFDTDDSPMGDVPLNAHGAYIANSRQICYLLTVDANTYQWDDNVQSGAGGWIKVGESTMGILIIDGGVSRATKAGTRGVYNEADFLYASALHIEPIKVGAPPPPVIFFFGNLAGPRGLNGINNN